MKLTKDVLWLRNKLLREIREKEAEYTSLENIQRWRHEEDRQKTIDRLWTEIQKLKDVISYIDQK